MLPRWQAGVSFVKYLPFFTPSARPLGQLHAADVLMSGVPPDAAEILKRSGKIERKRWTQQLLNPLAIRIPLLDPERFLQATAWLVRPIFTVWGAGLWLFVVGTAVVLAARNWDALTTNFADRVLAAESLLTMALVYPLVKAIHALGHAYAVKHWGGEVQSNSAS